MLSSEAIDEANRRGEERRATTPHAVAARYDARVERVVVTLSSKVELMFSPNDAEGLEQATPNQLSRIEISPSGYGLHFPELDADLYVPSLLEGLLGSAKWMAARRDAETGPSARRKREA